MDTSQEFLTGNGIGVKGGKGGRGITVRKKLSFFLVVCSLPQMSSPLSPSFNFVSVHKTAFTLFGSASSLRVDQRGGHIFPSSGRLVSGIRPPTPEMLRNPLRVAR